MLDDQLATPQFPATRWSVVLAASGGGGEARAALEEICRLYWFPLYAFARQRGLSAEDAEDQTQEFLTAVATGELLGKAAPDRGKLRTYLLSAFQRDLIDAHRRATSRKRGGGVSLVSLDSLAAEDRFRTTPLLDSATGTFDRAWAMTCLDSALCLVESEYTSRGRTSLFEVLRSFLDPDVEGDYSTAARQMGMDVNAARQAVFRLRQRFRVALRQTVADTLDQPSDILVDEELTTLRAALAGA